MLGRIEALRKEPKSVRNRYAFGFAMAVTLMVAFVWMLSLPSRIHNVSVVSETAQEGTESSPDIKETLSEIGTLLGDSLTDIQAQAELLGSEAAGTTSVNMVATSSNRATTSLRSANDSSIENSAF